MKINPIASLLLATVFLSGCVPGCSTTTYYQATGENSRESRGCGLRQESEYIFPLTEERWANSENHKYKIVIDVGGGFRPPYQMLLTVTIFFPDRMIVEVALDEITVSENGLKIEPVAGNPNSLKPRKYRSDVMNSDWFRQNFQLGAEPPAQLVVKLGPGAVKIDGTPFPFPPLMFEYATKTNYGFIAVNC